MPRLALQLGLAAVRLRGVPGVVRAVGAQRQVDQARAQLRVLLQHLLHAVRGAPPA